MTENQASADCFEGRRERGTTAGPSLLFRADFGTFTLL